MRGACPLSLQRAVHGRGHCWTALPQRSPRCLLVLCVTPELALWARGQGLSWGWGFTEVNAQLELGLSLGLGLRGLTQGHASGSWSAYGHGLMVQPGIKVQSMTRAQPGTGLTPQNSAWGSAWGQSPAQDQGSAWDSSSVQGPGSARSQDSMQDTGLASKRTVCPC